MNTVQLTVEEAELILSQLPANCKERGLLESKIWLSSKSKGKVKSKEQKNKVGRATTQRKAETYRNKLILYPTQAEKLFKAKLDDLKISHEFQKIIYTSQSHFRIVDFYLPNYEMIIEIDGKYHETTEQQEKDSFRTDNLKSLGYDRIIRITNEDVLNNKFPTSLQILGLNTLDPILN